VPIVFKSVSLIFLEPSGPVQACNGIDFPFYIILIKSVLCRFKEKSVFMREYSCLCRQIKK